MSEDMRDSPLPEWAQKRYVQGLRQFTKDELRYLWGQLADAYGSYLSSSWMGQPPSDFRAGNDQWSGRCEGLGERIMAATTLVGPISWRDVGMSALANGWFEWANTKLGITHPDLPDEAGMEQCRQWVADQTKGLV